MESKRPSTIDEALKILDEALVKQQIPDLTPLLGDEFNAVKSKISETGLSEFKDLQAGLAHAKELGAQLNKKVQENPWPLIGGIALGAAAFGYLLGQRSGEE